MISVAVCILITWSASAGAADTGCLVIAHRGASGYVPEHTLAAYRLAILLGADYVEPDLVWTRDGVPVARHENRLDGTTDVADRPEFAHRRGTRVVDGQETEGWFSEDFTLAELQTLRARERLPEVRPANTALNGLFRVPTLQEIIDMVREMETVVGRRVGIYPELKSPAYFRSRDLDPEVLLLEILTRNGFSDRDDPVFIQSFEIDSLQRLNELTELRLVLLVARDPDQPELTDQQLSDAGLAAIAAYADGIGVEKYGLLIPKDAQEVLLPGQATDLPARAHRAGLLVHAWTFRAENQFLPANLRSRGPVTAPGDSLAEHRTFIAAGVDGFFTEQPEVARQACQAEGAR